MKRYEAHCDASMNRKRRSAGLGFVILDRDFGTHLEMSSVARLSRNCSFTAELFAMAFACETLINLGVNLDDTILMCDCLTLVMKVNAEIPIPDGKNLLVDAAWEKISTAKSLGLSFSWIRGHSVSKLNCIADKLAGTAAKGVKRSDGKDTNT